MMMNDSSITMWDDEEFETTELLDGTFAMSEKEVLYDSLDQLDAMVGEMEDGVEQGVEVWTTFEGILQEKDGIALDRKEFYLLKEQRGPLMELFRKKPPCRVVDLILENWPEDVRVSKVTDDNGRTILFHAIQGGASARVIEKIVEKDGDVIKPLAQNHRYPLAEACVRASIQEEFDLNSKKTIRYLMKKGREKEYGISPLVATIGNRDIADHVIEFILAVGDREFKNEMLTARSPATDLTPLQIALLNDQRSDHLIARLLENEQSLSFDVLDNLLVRGRAGSRSLQSLVNRKMTERWPVAVLLFELYLRTVLVAAFVHASVEFFANRRDPGSHVAIYFFEFYFILKELFELRFRGPTYILDLWNVVDIANIVLVLLSVLGMDYHTGNGRDSPDWLQNTVLVTGGLVVLSLILFLRAAFLPFAIFVGGLIQILLTLGPFLVVSALMVFAFSFMYFVRRIEGSCCCTPNIDDPQCIPIDEFDNGDASCNNCSLQDTVLETLQFFYSGPDRTNTAWLDQVFGVSAVVILLNVVIAIVSDAWEDNKKMAGAQFWGYRIGFLAEVNSIGWIRNCLAPLLGLSPSSGFNPSNLNIWVSGECFWDDRDSAPAYQLDNMKQGKFNLFKAIDDLGRWSIMDSTPWVEPPYETRIHDANDYYRYTLGFVKYNKKTAEWLSKEDYKKLISCGSFERNWYWTCQPSHREDRLKYPYIKTRLQIACEFVIYLLLLPLGLVTVGLFWPRRIREDLFGVGVMDEDDDMSEEISNAIKTESRKRASAIAAKRASAMSRGSNSGAKPPSSGYSAGTRINTAKRSLKRSMNGTAGTARKATTRKRQQDDDNDSSNATRNRIATMEKQIASLERKLDGTARMNGKLDAKLDLILKIVSDTNQPRISTGTAGLYDEGKMSDARVSFLDDAGGEETSLSGKSSGTELEG